MFKKTLQVDEAIILADQSESIANASIHMFFMNFDIATIWLDANKIVVDKTIAKKWHPFYAPRKPAQYVIEAHPSQINNFSIGDQVIFESA